MIIRFCFNRYRGFSISFKINKLFNNTITLGFISLAILPFFIIIFNPSVILPLFEKYSGDPKFIYPLRAIIESNSLIDIILSDPSYVVRDINIGTLLNDTPLLQWFFGGGSNSVSSYQLIEYSTSLDMTFLEYTHKSGIIGIGLLMIFFYAIYCLNPFVFASIFLYTFIQDVLSNSAHLLTICSLSLIFYCARYNLSMNEYNNKNVL